MDAKKIDKKNSIIYFYIGANYYELNKKKEAIENFKISLKYNSENPDTLNYLAYIYAEEGINLNEALKLVRKALSYDSENYAYIDTLAWIYYKKGDFRKAKEELEKAKEIMEKKENKDSVIYEHLGEVYLKLNQIEKSKFYYEEAYKISPKEELKMKLEELK
jgi:tetratricopeptide (TPR) repeat protein